MIVSVLVISQDGLAVLSVFLIITDDNHENFFLEPLMVKKHKLDHSSCSIIAHIQSELTNLREVDSRVNITKPFPLRMFLPQPQFRNRFFRLKHAFRNVNTIKFKSQYISI